MTSGESKTVAIGNRSMIAKGCRGRRNKQVEHIFRALKLLCMVDTYYSKPIECTAPRVSPNISYGLWVIMM
jgi:hypothetical protein